MSLSRQLSSYLRRRTAKFDVVHVHTLYSFVAVTAASEARRARIPYVLSPCGSLDPYTHRRRGRVRKEIFQAAFHHKDLSRAAAVHFLSKGELELAKPFGITAPQVVINLGLSVEKYAGHSDGAFRSERPELARSRLIMYLGRISYTKGLDLLVGAFSRIAGHFPDARLLLVGPDYEGYGQVLARMLRDNGLASRVVFTGLISEVEKLSALAAAEIFVLPSYTEAFGIALLEAMASELPVILTDRAALAATIAETRSGVVVPSDVDSLAAALASLLEDSSKRKELSDRARSVVETQFSWNRSARAFADLYQAVCNRSPVVESLGAAR